MTTKTTKTRETFGVALSVFLLAWAALFAVFALGSRWWLLAAFPLSFIGVLGLAVELSRPKAA